MKTRNVSIPFVLLVTVCLTAGSASAISDWQTGTSYEDLITGGNATASSLISSPSTDPGISGAYLLSFHACDPDASNCDDPRNHNVYLAQSDDGANWSLVPGWEPYAGSVPDVIRRGDTLYIYHRDQVRRYDFATETWESPVTVDLPGTEATGLPTDASLIIDDQDRLVMFYLVGIVGGDPARCPEGEDECVKYFRSATEVEGSDGTEFVAESGDRVAITILSESSASDPDIFYDGSRYVLYISRGPSMQVYTSSTLHGDYVLSSSLPDGYLTYVVGIGSGYFDQATLRYLTYGHTLDGIIRRAVHTSLDESLSDSDFTTVLTGGSIDLGSSSWVNSPGFAVNGDKSSGSNNWTFTEDNVSLGISGVSPEAILLTDGSVRLYVTGGIQGMTLYRASDGLTFTKETASLPLGGSDPTLIRLGDGTYRMYYNDLDTIKTATSPDGLAWTEESSTGISNTTGGMAWGVPDSIELPDGRIRLYWVDCPSCPTPPNGYEVIKSAISSGGLTFTEESGYRTEGGYVDPHIMLAETGNWVGLFPLMPLFDPEDDTQPMEMYVGTSTDGLTWSIESEPIITVSGGNAFDPASYPLGDGSYRIYYPATSALDPPTNDFIKSGILKRKRK